ncbi:MAG: hypothetical protein K5683_07340 [Prevotella sp.]|nr:hypothetical protein [Prevotella sp.]
MKCRLTYLLFLLMLLSACSAEDTDSTPDRESQDVAVNAALTRATAESVSDATTLTGPQFIFWTATHFDADPQSLATPFIAQVPSGTIDDYNSTRYNTFERYPDNNELVYATGFWPAPVTSGTGLTFTSANDYTSFDIPEEWVGKKDILVANGVITGNEAHPFTTSTPLEFIHAQAQLIIYAKLADDMSKFVKHITLEFTNASRPELLVWNKLAGRYVVQGGKTTSRLVTDYGQTLANQLSKDRTQFVDNIFIVPTTSTSVTANIKFWMADTAEGLNVESDLIKKESGDITISFVDADSNPINLNAGDSYTLTLEFGVNTINLYGRLKAWEDGGYVAVPIKIATS